MIALPGFALGETPEPSRSGCRSRRRRPRRRHLVRFKLVDATLVRSFLVTATMTLLAQHLVGPPPATPGPPTMRPERHPPRRPGRHRPVATTIRHKNQSAPPGELLIARDSVTFDCALRPRSTRPPPVPSWTPTRSGPLGQPGRAAPPAPCRPGRLHHMGLHRPGVLPRLFPQAMGPVQGLPMGRSRPLHAPARRRHVRPS